MPRASDPRFAPDCHIVLDGRPLPARAGESAAAALIAAGVTVIARSAKYHRPRGAFCLSGTCHGCLARVDGIPNQRTCLATCRPGLAVETQNAFPGARHDVLGAIDLVYRRGLDHHHLATWNALANRAAVAVSRRLAGAGTLASAPAPAAPPAAALDADALVVGAGPAGLAASEVLAGRGRRVVLADSGTALGGRLRSALHAPHEAAPGWERQVARAVEASGAALPGHTVVGLWRDGGGVVALLRDDATDRLTLLRPAAVVVATGTTAVPPLFPRNDLPGIFAGRGLARALSEEGLVPGRRCAVASDDAEGAALAQRLRAAGSEVQEVRGVAAARGGRHLAAIVDGGGRVVMCDALAWCGARAPAAELARALGAEVSPVAAGWAVRAGPQGDTAVPGLWAAGEVVQPGSSVADAVAAGRRAGEAAAGHR